MPQALLRHRTRHTLSLSVKLAQNAGAIAQLGEHLHGMQKVRGSSPRRSTTLLTLPGRGNIAHLMVDVTDQFGRFGTGLALRGVAGA